MCEVQLHQRLEHGAIQSGRPPQCASGGSASGGHYPHGEEPISDRNGNLVASILTYCVRGVPGGVRVYDTLLDIQVHNVLAPLRVNRQCPYY